MSLHDPDYRLAEHARLDYEEILLYSQVTWGERQMRKYEATLQRSLELLALNPESGTPRPDLGRGVRARYIQPYFAYYRIEDGIVVIARILHEKRDVTADML